MYLWLWMVISDYEWILCVHGGYVWLSMVVSGPLLAAKITLRCESCHLNYRQVQFLTFIMLSFELNVHVGLSHRYDQYGCESTGYFYYKDEIRPHIRASKVCYVGRVCYETWCSLA